MTQSEMEKYIDYGVFERLLIVRYLKDLVYYIIMRKTKTKHGSTG